MDTSKKFYPASFGLAAQDVLELMLDRLNDGDTIYLEDDEGEGSQQPLPIQLRQYTNDELLAHLDEVVVQEFVNNWYEPVFVAAGMEWPNMGRVTQKQEHVILNLMNWLDAALENGSR